MWKKHLDRDDSRIVGKDADAARLGSARGPAVTNQAAL